MTERITAIIAEDEPALRRHLRERLLALWPGLMIAGEAADGITALALIAGARPDVAFLDIRMPGLSGLEVARRAPAGTRVVFVTAYDQYAVDAFEQAAVDYLLKPVSDERLAATLARLRERLPAAAHDLAARVAQLEQLMAQLASPPVPAYLGWLRVGLGEEVRLVPVEEVIYFRAEDKYTTVVTGAGEHLIRTSIKQLEDELDPRLFWRVHRAIIVNSRRIERVSRTFAGGRELHLKDRPERLPVSRAYSHLFRQM